MQMKSQVKDGVLILKLMENRLDAKLAVSFRETVEGFINDGQHAIAFDMTDIDFIDSSGLGAIVTCLKKMGAKGKMVLFGLRMPVASMFKLTRMDRVFTICDEEGQALQAFE